MNTAKLEEANRNSFQDVAVTTLSAITYVLSIFVSVLAFVKFDFLSILYYGIIAVFCVEVIIFKLREENSNQSPYGYLKKQWVSFYNRFPMEKVPTIVRHPTSLFVFLLYIFIRVTAAQLLPFCLYLVITGAWYWGK